MDSDILNRRRNYFIKKKFQANFIIRFCLLVIFGALMSGVIVYLASTSTVTTTFDNSRLTMKSTADFILPAVLLSSAVVIVVIGLAAIGVTLFTSHKIAGPLYRMEKDVEEVAAGNLKKRFQLRTTDELKILAKDLDDMTQTFRADIGEIKRLASEIESGTGDPAARDRIEKLKKSLEKFDT